MASTTTREAKRHRETLPDVNEIMIIARRLWQRRNPFLQYTAQQEDRSFRESFGCNAMVVLEAWRLLSSNDLIPANASIEHLLWTLSFMKSYNTRRNMSTLCGGADAGTINSYAFAFIESLADLEPFVIVWENRFRNDRNADCLVSVDGVDFRIPNHGPEFASHKFKGKSGLRYEIALCIQTGDCVWVNGPYPCGRNPDITIFRDSLMHFLDDGERVEADDGYVGEAPEHVKCPKSFTNEEECLLMQQRVRNRQETINNRLKFWGILAEAGGRGYRHDLGKHGSVVRAILVIIQLCINLGEPLFQTGYQDPPFPPTDPNNPPRNTGFQRNYDV